MRILSIFLLVNFFNLFIFNANAGVLNAGIPTPETHKTLDRFNVSMVDGTPNIPGMAISIGTAESGIERDPGTNRYINHNHVGTITKVVVKIQASNTGIPGYAQLLTPGTYYKVDSQGQSEIFKFENGDFTNHTNTGGTLECEDNICIYLTKQHIEVEFDTEFTNNFSETKKSNFFTAINFALQTKVTKPDGEVLLYSYKKNNSYKGYLLRAATSSLGWMLKYEHVDAVYGETDINGSTYYSMEVSKTVRALNTTKEFCDPDAELCSETSYDWPWVQISGGEYISKESGATDFTGIASFHGVNLVPIYSTHRAESDITNVLGHTNSFKQVSHPCSSGGFSYKTEAGINYSYSTYGGYTYPVSPGVYECKQHPSSGRVYDVYHGGKSFGYSPSSNVTVSPDGSYQASQQTGRLRYYKDKLSRKWEYDFDEFGNYVDIITNPDLGYADYDYDNRGNIKSVKRYPNDNSTNYLETSATYFTCDENNKKYCNKAETITDENGVTTTYTYHPQSGNIATVTREAVTVDGQSIEAQTRYTYQQKTPKVLNSSGNLEDSTPVWRLTKISKCMTKTLYECEGTDDELITEIEYDHFTDSSHNNVLPTKQTVKLGDNSVSLATETYYDIYGNVKWVDGPKPGTYDRVYYFYDELRQLKGEIQADPDGSGSLKRKATWTEYNPDGKVTSVKTGYVSSTTQSDVENMAAVTEIITEYSDVHGLPIWERHYANSVFEMAYQTSYDYRLNKQCVAKRVVEDTTYSACEITTSTEYGNSPIIKYSYDATDTIEKVESGVGSDHQRADREYIYGATTGLLDEEKDGKGNTTFYKYDKYSRLEKTVYPNKTNGSTESNDDFTKNTYKTGTNLVEKVRLRDGQEITFHYDDLGRVEQKTGAVAESFVYNNFDQVVTHANETTNSNVSVAEFGFNALGWKLTETIKSAATLQQALVAQNGKTVETQYNDYGQRDKLIWPDNFTIDYDYAVNGYQSDLVQHIKKGSTNEASFTYYDNGLRETLTRGDDTVTTYEYDDWFRLELLKTNTSNYLKDIEEEFTYTPYSQVRTRSLSVYDAAYKYNPINGTTDYGEANALNQLTEKNGSTIGYDDRGNLTSLTGRSYVYNANNLLTSSTKSGVTSTLTYDAENRLASVSKSGVTTKFIYDGQDLIAELDANGNVIHRYVHGPNIDDPIVWYVGAGTATKRYFYENHLGSIVGITNSDGSSYAINAYDEYGNQAPNNVGRFSYTGQVWLPEVELYYYKARMYNPDLGRFMQTDPIGYKDGMNWYAYVGNNPVNLIDPSGKNGKLKPKKAQLQESAAVVSVVAEAIVSVTEPGSGIHEVASAVAEQAQSIMENGGVKGKKSAARQLAKNKAVGDAHEKQVKDNLQQTQSGVVQQVSVKTQSGTTTRIDLMGRDANGNIVCTECKASDTAPLTKNQKIAFPEIQQSGGIVVGKGKPGFPGGTQIPPTTVVIVRP